MSGGLLSWVVFKNNDHRRVFTDLSLVAGTTIGAIVSWVMARQEHRRGQSTGAQHPSTNPAVVQTWDALPHDQRLNLIFRWLALLGLWLGACVWIFLLSALGKKAEERDRKFGDAVDSARVHWRKQEYEKATEEYTRALDLIAGMGKPQDHVKATSRLYCERGEVYCLQKEYEKAIADFEQAILLNSDAPEPYLKRADVYVKTRNWEKVITDLTEVIRLDRRNVAGYIGRAMAYCERKEWAKGLVDFTEAIRLDGSDPLAYYGRAGLYFETKEWEKAIADSTQVIRLGGRKAESHLLRAYAYSERKEWEKAIADFTEVIRLDGSNAHAYRGRARAYSEVGKDNQSEADRRQAEALESRSGKELQR
jgi:tetratricopeptide (TPR) repeat protein